MKRRMLRALLIAGILAPSAVPVYATPVACAPYADLKPSVSGTKVAQICYNGQPVPGIRALVTPPHGAPESRQINTNWTIPSGTSITVPDATYIDLVDARAAFRSSPGMRITVAQAGYELDGGGRAQFAVVRVVQNALDFFGVKVGRFVAAAPGTVFRVDLTNPNSVTFGVSEGRVAVTREVSIGLAREKRTVTGVLVAKYVTVDDAPLTYDRGAELYATFKDANEARSTFKHDLEVAQRIGDPILAVAARETLMRVNAKALPGWHSNILRTVLGAAAAKLIIHEVTKKRSPTASPSPTRAPPHVPSPSPSPSPTGSPPAMPVPVATVLPTGG